MSDDEDDRKPAATVMDEIPEATNAAAAIGVKPALKKDSTVAAKPSSKSKDEKKHLKWDEVAIEEHDALRGTRMKIDEPNTPYTHYDSGAESDDSRRPKSPAMQKQTLSWDLLQTRLDSVAAVREAYPSSPSSHATAEHSSDIEQLEKDDRQKEMRQLEFKEHRKRHYNEMELVKKFRQEHPEGALAAPPDENFTADAVMGGSSNLSHASADADDEQDDEEE